MISIHPALRFRAAIGLAIALAPSAIRAQEPAPRTDMAALQTIGRALAARAELDRREALAWSALTGEPLIRRNASGGGSQLVGFENGVPLCFTTMNAVAADTT